MNPVLVIDDEDDSRTSMAESLRMHGYSVVEKANGREALDYLLSGAADQPGCILLDLAMPVMSGWEFIAIVKSYYRLGRIPIVVVSGKEMPEEAQRHGVIDGFIEKPHDPETLSTIIGAAMRASTRLRAAKA
jgi:two-component system, OmpR family, response regulator ResD